MSGLSITGYFPFKRMKILYQNIHHEDASSALIRMTPDMRYTPLCHQCGDAAATVHSKEHHRFIRDLNMANAQVFLQVDCRKIWLQGPGRSIIMMILSYQRSGRVRDYSRPNTSPKRKRGIGNGLPSLARRASV